MGFMENSISIDQQTCKVCGLCSEVCPNKILSKNPLGGITFRQDRLSFCMKCGQCMAICPTKSIRIEGLSYSGDFFEIPERLAVEAPFFNMIASRRAIRNFRDQACAKGLIGESRSGDHLCTSWLYPYQNGNRGCSRYSNHPQSIALYDKAL